MTQIQKQTSSMLEIAEHALHDEGYMGQAKTSQAQVKLKADGY